MKRLLALLFLCMLLPGAALTAAEEETDWYSHWTLEMDINLGKQNEQLEEDTGVRNYIDPETGMTSAIVGDKTDKNAVIWVKEEAGGESAWFGLDNSSGVFQEGSRFWVRWLNREWGSKEWKDCYDRFDDEHKRIADKEYLWIFLIGVTAPDGKEYAEFKPDVPLYVQIGDAWDEQKVHAAYIAEGADETKLVTYTENLAYPQGTDQFAELKLNHFSPYVIYQEVIPALPQTGDNSSLALWCAVTVIAGAVLMLMRRRARNEQN